MVSSYVKIRKRTKRISLQRFLVTKIVLEMGRVTNYDILALYENQLWLERKCETDYDFSRKFSKDLGGLSKIMKEVNLRHDFSPGSLELMRAKIRNDLESFLVPTRNFASFRSRFAGTFQVLPSRSEGVPIDKLPPKRFIGKGYGDKGTLKKDEDGSPSWQELSSALSYEELFTQETQNGKIHERIRESVEKAKTFEDIQNLFINIFEGGLKGPIPSTWSGSLTSPPTDPEAVKRFKASGENREPGLKLIHSK